MGTVVQYGEEQLDEGSLAKCIEHNIPTSFFFPVVKPGRQPINQKLEAKQREAANFCNGVDDGKVCPRKELCLLDGLRPDEPGVWGGTTEADRRIILRKRNKNNQQKFAV